MLHTVFPSTQETAVPFLQYRLASGWSSVYSVKFICPLAHSVYFLLLLKCVPFDQMLLGFITILEPKPNENHTHAKAFLDTRQPLSFVSASSPFSYVIPTIQLGHNNLRESFRRQLSVHHHPENSSVSIKEGCTSLAMVFEKYPGFFGRLEGPKKVHSRPRSFAGLPKVE